MDYSIKESISHSWVLSFCLLRVIKSPLCHHYCSYTVGKSGQHLLRVCLIIKCVSRQLPANVRTNWMLNWQWEVSLVASLNGNQSGFNTISSSIMLWALGLHIPSQLVRDQCEWFDTSECNIIDIKHFLGQIRKTWAAPTRFNFEFSKDFGLMCLKLSIKLSNATWLGTIYNMF